MHGNQLVPQLLLKQSHSIDSLNIWCQNINFWQNDSFANSAIFSCFLLNRGYACTWIVHTQWNQLVPYIMPSFIKFNPFNNSIHGQWILFGTFMELKSFTYTCSGCQGPPVWQRWPPCQRLQRLWQIIIRTKQPRIFNLCIQHQELEYYQTGLNDDPDPVGFHVAHCVHSISWTNGWILTKLAQIHFWEGGKKWLDFVTLTSFSKSHQHFKIFKFWPQKKLVCTLSLEPNDGFWPNFIYCNIGMV